MKRIIKFIIDHLIFLIGLILLIVLIPTNMPVVFGAIILIAVYSPYYFPVPLYLLTVNAITFGLRKNDSVRFRIVSAILGFLGGGIGCGLAMLFGADIPEKFKKIYRFTCDIYVLLLIILPLMVVLLNNYFIASDSVINF